MDKEGFRKYLTEREIPEDKIKDSIRIVQDFELSLGESKTATSATGEDLSEYSKSLIESGENSYDNYVALARYGYFAKNNDLYLAVLELLDGGNVMEILHEKLGKIIGNETRNIVFEETGLPPLGTPSTEKTQYTQAIMEKLESIVDEEKCQEVLAEVAHGLPREYRKQERERFLEAGDIDIYLKDKRKNAISELKKHRDKGTLFFNQEITDEVLDWIKSRLDILTGERRGNIIYHTKIPYMTKEYLEEADETLKRYYACHCAWAREAIKAGEPDISPTFCYCSAGFTKVPWEVALGRELKVEVVKSVLKGDLECSFKIYLPDYVLDK